MEVAIIKNKNDMRLAITITWVISFAFMWIILNTFLPKNEFNMELNQIEKSIEIKDWKQAKESMEELKRIYNKNRILIKANNATEILTTFEFAIGQLDISVQHEQDAALEYIGGLKSSLDFVMNAFSGP
jgi:tellurite resistance protein